MAETLESHRGLLALAGEQPVGAMLLAPDGHLLRMRRVSVHPEAQNAGVAGAMIGTAERIAAEEGYDGLVLGARAELPSTVDFWRHLGYDELDREGTWRTMADSQPSRSLSSR